MKKEGPIFIRFTMEQITLRFERKTLKDMKGDFTKERLTTDHIENAFNMTRGNIKNHFEESKKNKTDAVKVKYYREIFDLEICCDCIIDLMGTLQLTERMKEWDPFPFNDNGERYSHYKKERFNTPSGVAKDVSDEFIIELLKSDAEDENSEEVVNDSVNNNAEHRVAVKKIKQLRNENKALKLHRHKPSQMEMKEIIDRCRFKNDKCNNTKVGEVLGIHSDTAKAWIKQLGLSDYAWNPKHLK